MSQPVAMSCNAESRAKLPGAFFVTLLATMLFAMSFTMLTPVMPLFITDELGVSERWIGTATLLVASTAVTMRIPSGALSDRQNRRRIMLIGAVLGVMAACLNVASRTVGLFMVARIIAGASLALFTTAGKALAADLAPPERRGEGMGLYNGAFSLAQAVSFLLGEGVEKAAGFLAVFVLGGALTLGSLLVTLALPATQPDRTGSQGVRRDILHTLRMRGSWAAILLAMSMGATLALMFTFFPLMADRKNLFEDAPGLFAPVAIGMGLSIYALVDTVVEPVAGRISDRIGRRAIAIPGLVVVLGGIALLGRASATIDSYAAIVVLTIGWGMTRAAADAMAQDVVAPALRGMAAAVLYTGFDSAVGTSAQLLSTLIDGANFGAFFRALKVIVFVFGVAGLALSARLLTYEQRLARAAAASSSGD